MGLGFFLLGIIVVLAASVVYGASQPAPPTGLTDDHIREELRKGNKLVAIRWYRVLHRVGLKDAKDGVSKLARLQ
jgi:ribosomal protein L7/L12